MILMPTSWWRICLVCSSIQSAVALDYGTLPNTAFPLLSLSGPIVQSQRYIVPPRPLEPSTGASLLIPTSNPWDAIVNDPKSPLILKAYVSPLTVKSGNPVTIHAEMIDEKKIRNTQIIAKSNEQTITLKSIGQNKFQGTMIAPSSKKPLDWLIEIRATGERFDKAPFIREATLQAFVVHPDSGFQKVWMNQQGDITLKLKSAHGLYRIEIIYGNKNQAVAWARELVTLKGQEQTIRIQKPPSLTHFQQALVKLLSMDRLSLEDEVLINFHLQ